MPQFEAITTEIKYISTSIQELKDLAKNVLEEQKKTNGRITKLETEMEAVKGIFPKVEQNSKDLATFKMFGPLATSILSGIVSFFVFLFTRNHQ